MGKIREINSSEAVLYAAYLISVVQKEMVIILVVCFGSFVNVLMVHSMYPHLIHIWLVPVLVMCQSSVPLPPGPVDHIEASPWA